MLGHGMLGQNDGVGSNAALYSLPQPTHLLQKVVMDAGDDGEVQCSILELVAGRQHPELQFMELGEPMSGGNATDCAEAAEAGGGGDAATHTHTHTGAAQLSLSASPAASLSPSPSPSPSPTPRCGALGSAGTGAGASPRPSRSPAASSQGRTCAPRPLTAPRGCFGCCLSLARFGQGRQQQRDALAAQPPPPPPTLPPTPLLTPMPPMPCDAGIRRAASALTKPVPDALLAVLSGIDQWEFDVFELAALTDGRPLSVLAFALFKRAGLVAALNLSEAKVARFLSAIEAGYGDHPYHGRNHAADVLHSIHVISTRGGLLQAMSSSSGPGGLQSRSCNLQCDCEQQQQQQQQQQQPSRKEALHMLGMYMAAVVHDFDHRGVTNGFLVQDEDPLALLYNDTSPQEHHHLAAAFAVLRQPANDFTAPFSRPMRDWLREHVIAMVLGTDMRQHLNLLSLFESRITAAAAAAAPDAGGGAAAEGATGVGPYAAWGPSSDPGGGCQGPGPGHSPGRLSLPSPVSRFRAPEAAAPEEAVAAGLLSQEMDAEMRLLVWKMALKCADLGHIAREEAVHRQWVCLLEEEMFRQGDLEKARGYPVSPLMDRCKDGVTRSQPGFFKAIAIPLFTALSDVLPGIQPMLARVTRNYAMWRLEQSVK